MTWKVLVSAPYFQPVVKDFMGWFDEHGIEVVLPPVRERLSADDLMPWIGDVDGVISGDDEFSDRVLAVAPRLKVISKWGTGIDSIDLQACGKRGIAVRNTPNAFSEPVADSVIGYILCFARNLPWMNRSIRDSAWEKIPGRALRECVLGIIGVGDVGKAVARRAVVFDMQVLGNDLVEMPPEFLKQTNIEMVSKEDLLRRADFVSLNCNLNPTSFHLMNDERFSMMKSTAVVINTARGPVIDERALVRALRKKQIGGAALDVFEKEPLPDDSPLREMDNVMLAPHNANSSPEAWNRVHWRTIVNLVEELRRHER